MSSPIESMSEVMRSTSTPAFSRSKNGIESDLVEHMCTQILQEALTSA